MISYQNGTLNLLWLFNSILLEWNGCIA